MGKTWHGFLALPLIAVIAWCGVVATSGPRGFGVVDEPLYAINAIGIAGSVIDGGPADLDIGSSSHPPMGAALLALGLFGPPIFTEPHVASVGHAVPICTIASPGGIQRAELLFKAQSGQQWSAQLATWQVSLSSEPLTCVDLVDRAALLLADGSIVFVQPIQVEDETNLGISEPIVDPAGGWTAMSPAAPGPGGALLARSKTGFWWRLNDATADAPRMQTDFSGERLVGVGVVGYLDGSNAALTSESSRKVIKLFDACLTSTCGSAEEALRSGRLLLNGDVEPESRDELLRSLEEIGGIDYGQTRIAMGVKGSQMVLVDLDQADQDLAVIPYSATRLHWAISGGGPNGWNMLVATRTRLTKLEIRTFPEPSLLPTDERRFSEIIAIGPAGGSSLATVAALDSDGSLRLVLVERTRLRAVSGGRVEVDAIPLGGDTSSLSGGRGSTMLFESRGRTLAVDTGAAADRMRLSSQIAFVSLVVAASAIGLLVSPLAAVVAGIVLLGLSITAEQARVAMLDGWLAALLAWSTVAVVASTISSGRRRRGALIAAGALIGAALGVKFSAAIVGLPLLALAAFSNNARSAVESARVALAAIGLLGALVSAVGVFAGAGIGGVLNFVAGIALLVVSRIRISRQGAAKPLNRQRLLDALITFTAAGAGALLALSTPALIGSTISGTPLDVPTSLHIWLAQALGVAEGFTLDHPLGLPFWGLVVGLGLGFSLSASPSLLMMLWAGSWVRVPVSAPRAEQLVSLLFLVGLLSVAVWAPLSRILFPWYAVPLAVPIAAAIGIALTGRSTRWRMVGLAAAIAPALAWLAGPTVCLASIARLDRGCQAIVSTDMVGTAVLAAATLALAFTADRARQKIEGIFGHGLRVAALQLAFVFSGTFASLAVTTALPALSLQGFAVVVGMEGVWAATLFIVLLLWRFGRWRIASLVGGSLILVELFRATGTATGLRNWYLVPTQVGRVIPEPLLHPVPMSIMGVITMAIVAAAMLLRSRWSWTSR